MERKYTNIVKVEVSTYDFCFVFGVRSQEQSEKEEFDSVAELFTSPHHAKAFYLALGKTIEQYEKQLGEISLRPAGAKDEQK